MEAVAFEKWTLGFGERAVAMHLTAIGHARVTGVRLRTYMYYKLTVERLKLFHL